MLNSMMHKWYGGVLAGSLCALLLLRYGLTNQPILNDSIPTMRPFDGSASLKLGEVENRETDDPVVSVYLELTRPILQVLQTWTYLKHVSNYTKGIPNAVESIREGRFVWERLMVSFEKKLGGDENGSFVDRRKDEMCPYDVQRMNSTELGDDAYRLQIPCGLVKGSSITIVGVPVGDFWIDLTGEPVRWKPKSRVLLDYNIRFRGDNVTEDPVIVQNTWSETDNWGEEERCPLPSTSSNKKVDGLSQCNEMIGKNENQNIIGNESKDHSLWLSMAQKGSTKVAYFPFKQGYLSVMTLRTAPEGFQMTVDGNHITAFAYRENMEPWLVHELRISGQFNLISMVANGLPTSDDSQHGVDLEALKSAPLLQHKSLDLFIGVFSAVNNFKRRMAIRRTWMQYPEVRRGSVAVRFFVSLHKSQAVNEKLWGEVQTYGDIQLLLSLDYYSLLIWKTLAICIFGTKVVSAKYVMKTDDDAFVRVNGLLTSLERVKVTKGLYYGLISNSSRPQRYNDSKWFVSDEEWSSDVFPPWAHGPGYVVSNDIAKAIYHKHEKGQLKMFKLEDVGMGIWISELSKEGLNVRYVNETKICTLQCKDGYLVAHYQTPTQMVCLWHMLRQGKGATCCSQR